MLLELADAHARREAGRSRPRRFTTRSPTRSCCRRRRRNAPAAVDRVPPRGRREQRPRPASPPSSSSSRTARCCRWCCSAAPRTRSRRPRSWRSRTSRPRRRPAYAEAAKKYEEVVEEVPRVRAREPRAVRPGAVLHRAGGLGEGDRGARSDPGPERNGDLAGGRYVLADCLIRTAPAKAEDALQDNMLREKLTAAASLLDAFVAANPKAEQTPDALLKLGSLPQAARHPARPGQRAERRAQQGPRDARAAARREFPQSPLVGAAHLERAKVMALQGDKGERDQRAAAVRQRPAPEVAGRAAGARHLATLLREQNQVAGRRRRAASRPATKFEGQLTADPARASGCRCCATTTASRSSRPASRPRRRHAFDQAVQAARRQADRASRPR